MTTRSSVAQVEVESKMRKIEAKIEDLKKTIKGYENEYDEATREEERKDISEMIIAKAETIIAAYTNLHDLREKLKGRQQQGNEQITRPFILFMVLSFPIDSLVVLLTIMPPHIF
jgi:hypothetical protein